MDKAADARKLDKKHISPESLAMMLQGNMQDALDRPDMQFLHAQAKERRRMLRGALSNPDFYRVPPEDRQEPVDPQLSSQFAPAGPGAPTAPGVPPMPGAPGGITPEAPGGMTPAAGLLNYFMTKLSAKQDAKVVDDKLRKEAFKYGFLMKLAEAGLKPTEFEVVMRTPLQKAAGGEGLGAGMILSKILELLGGAAGGVGSAALGIGKTLGVGTMALAPILGAIGGGSAYYATRPGETKAEDIKHLERVALYKRLARRARSRTKKEEDPASLETRADDAHRTMMPSGSGVEI